MGHARGKGQSAYADNCDWTRCEILEHLLSEEPRCTACEGLMINLGKWHCTFELWDTDCTIVGRSLRAETALTLRASAVKPNYQLAWRVRPFFVPEECSGQPCRVHLKP